MDWIKRNLLFVVGLAVAGLFLLAAGFYLYQSWDGAQTAYSELQTKTSALDTIVSADPFPNPENLKQVKEEQQRVEEFKKSARDRFGVQIKPDGLDNAAFKGLLESRLAGLVRDAEKTGVKLPDKYDFTFGEQRKVLQIPDKALVPLVLHLDDVTDLCRILYAARVHSLVSIKRTTVGTNDSNSSTDFLLAKKVTTNTVTGAAIYPYEIAFQGFSSELASVLAGLRDAPASYNIKTLNVERGVASDSSASSVPMAAIGLPNGFNPSMARYGVGPYARMQQPVAAAAPTRPNEPVLEPKLLRVTIGLDIVKLTAPASASGTNSPSAAPVKNTRQ